MKKGFNNFCSGDASTSTSTLINQKNSPPAQSPFLEEARTSHRQPTLEEMIMQLDLEEKMAKRPKLQEEYGHFHHRMSCVNSSDILRSARNALNQYPRFSLDGKDSMYRSSFHLGGSIRSRHARPAKVAGERVIWCKPGVVGRLMGLDAMPIPIRLKQKMKQNFRSKLDSNGGSCSKARTGYCLMKPVGVEITRDEAGWPMRPFL